MVVVGVEQLLDPFRLHGSSHLCCGPPHDLARGPRVARRGGPVGYVAEHLHAGLAPGLDHEVVCTPSDDLRQREVEPAVARGPVSIDTQKQVPPACHSSRRNDEDPRRPEA